MNVRAARLEDLSAMTAIRNHYILNSHALFETNPESVESRVPWFNRFSEKGPYRLFVAEISEEIVGFAYSSRYRDHESFSGTVETSVYVSPRVKAQGVGSLLYGKLMEILKQEKIHTAVAGIALPNEGSIALHKKFGFEEVGIFKEYAVKNGQYISSIWMQKIFEVRQRVDV